MPRMQRPSGQGFRGVLEAVTVAGGRMAGRGKGQAGFCIEKKKINQSKLYLHVHLRNACQDSKSRLV